jgi:ketosteroid isomerase-like protein
MTPRQTIERWVDRFNAGDVDGLVGLYAESATNHQVTQAPVIGRGAIREMFEREFAAAEMHCIPEHIFEDGPWAILEWRDPLGLRGCGFFHVQDGLIVFQRGYWDRLAFLRLHNLPIPNE